MSNNIASLQLFESSIAKVANLSELNHALQTFLASLAITTFSFTYYSYYTNALHKLKYDFASANFSTWHQHYLTEHYEEIDTTLEQVYRTVTPTLWVLEDQLKEARTPRERQMRLDSIAFGIVRGVSIPLHGPEGDFANFLVVQMKEETCLEKWEIEKHTLLAAGYYYFHYLQPLLLEQQIPNKKFQLNKREMQCLLLIAKQYSMDAIAKNLNITQRTVNYHIQRMNKKLGTKNKYQSVTKALQNNLIKL